MPTITLSVPVELKQEMDKSKFINWSEVAREAIRVKATQLRILNSIALKSKLTEKDADALAKSIKQSVWKKYKEKGW
jgi:hydrogenase-4 membrane subunit HyfE